MSPTKAPAYRPVVILGAGRSGTNMLRDILCSLPGYATWPCDEINYLWRHGNARFPHDAFPADLARPRVRRYMQHRFQQLAQKTGTQNVVEKTCANTLRVPFVVACLPQNAVFLHIRRDGRAVAASAAQRWSADLDLPYLLRKARFVPPLDLPYYGLRYLGTRMSRWFSSDRRVSFWGPRYPGLQEDLAAHDLIEVCALQWRRCVTATQQDLGLLPPERVLQLRYEDFVAEPATQLQRIGTFLGEDWSESRRQTAVQGVSSGNLEKWRLGLDQEQIRSLEQIVESVDD